MGYVRGREVVGLHVVFEGRGGARKEIVGARGAGAAKDEIGGLGVVPFCDFTDDADGV